MQSPVAKPHSRSLADWLAVLERLDISHIELGLERMQHVAGRLGLLSLPAHVITVGGTNGKGTTCALLESMLRAGGVSVGVYSSPHLLDYRERVRINGDVPAEQAFCEAFAAVEAARGDIALTYFEFGTLAALWLFRAACPDVVLLEVGLGGRLDATNVVDSDQAVITTIALDHTDWLGSDREAIGFEKAGILRPGKPAVCGDLDPPASIGEQAGKLGTPVAFSGRDFHWQQQGDSWSFAGLGLELEQLPVPGLPLMNAATALATLAASPFALTDEAIATGLREARLAGRLQRLAPNLWVDVAHNPESAAYLASRLQVDSGNGAIHGVVGMLKDKDIAATLAPLQPLVRHWYPATLGGPRGASGAVLAQAVGVEHHFGSVTEALQAALSACADGERVIVFGSFFTVAEALAWHGVQQGEH
ncbi:bifunctional folylpolyglutamate synthase/ dihydrofolate synthase [Oceanimonas sp. GK1]|jgi:dihydrofolate synthase/folylpolyglutamate synthase|uniref:bifunctional tetrahydrofolate synthase/dihydrofolate synthase n=1 Tax=Oceanimonas sp. (strain GK1 / IBRC-M 10197) TaxID=511062 RepID=UPI0002494E5B|nr:bifunctional tetrahydrofolate synthase/dihydrofolate synthase [Oceanimonas sp. GK1]AEY02122.1 bifunctional folylpolyglutamate synthase/ dihydrofolate synthase [Oceanimonas sp. GK1]